MPRAMFLKCIGAGSVRCAAWLPFGGAAAGQPPEGGRDSRPAASKLGAAGEQGAGERERHHTRVDRPQLTAEGRIQ